MKNVTLTLDPEVARWARIRAAEMEMSVSRFLGELLRREMAHESSYEAAMHQYLARGPEPLRPAGRRYPPREELHER